MNNKKSYAPASLIKNFHYLMLGSALVVALPDAQATEGGGSSYPMGAENYMTGAMPPPGFYS